MHMHNSISQYLVAAITCDPKLGMKERNIEEQYGLVEEAAKKGAKLIALPEMSTTGYCWYNREEIAPYVEPVPGPTTQKFGEIARKYECWIVVGMPEVAEETNIYYNSAVLIGPEGVIGVHRKTHNYVSEGKWAKQGDLNHKVYKTPIGNIGLLICMDITLMEPARLEGVLGADVIVSINNWVADKTPAMIWYTRAYENGCYLMVANRVGLERGTEFNGGSCLFGPDGKLLCCSGTGTSIVYGEIDLMKARDKSFAGYGHKMKDRRPEDYMDISLDPYLWDPLLTHGLYGYDPLAPGKLSRIGVAQYMPKTGDVDANIHRIEEEAIKLANGGCELVVFPELALTGYVDAVNAKKVAETLPGKSTDRLLDLCLRHRVCMVVGMIERDGEALYNTAIFFSPDGILGKYRKKHLDLLDESWATPGNIGFPYFNTSMGRIGILIGHDASFPEPARIHALHGVDILCCPSAVSEPAPEALAESRSWNDKTGPYGYNNVWWHLWRIRAGENNCYLAFANAVGKLPDGRKTFGRSGVFLPVLRAYPRNEMVLSGGDEDRASLVVDTRNGPDPNVATSHTRKKGLLSMRRTIWYDPLVMKRPPQTED